jgi:hypothetical protein
VPGAGRGINPGGQPFAGAMSTVGTSVGLGAGSVGCAPIPALIGSVAMSPHPERLANANPNDAAMNTELARSRIGVGRQREHLSSVMQCIAVPYTRRARQTMRRTIKNAPRIPPMYMSASAGQCMQ